MRTNRAGSSRPSTAAKRLILQERLPVRLERDVVVLRLDVVNRVDRQHVHLRSVTDQHALERAVLRSFVGYQRLNWHRIACGQPFARAHQRLGEALAR